MLKFNSFVHSTLSNIEKYINKLSLSAHFRSPTSKLRSRTSEKWQILKFLSNKLNKKIITLSTLAIIVFGLGGPVSSPGCGQSPKTTETTLIFWNLFDDSTAYSKIIADWQALHPGVKIAYYKKTDNYERELERTISLGQGPDIMAIKHNWLPKYLDRVTPIPPALMTPKQLKETFPDVVSDDMIYNNQIYGLPMAIDTLALYYNRELFNQAGILYPPKTWDEFKNYVERLTTYDSQGNVTRAGAVIGTAKNINRATDILNLLMFQNGAAKIISNRIMLDFTSPQAKNALQFYIDFADQTKRIYTWNQSLDYSIDMFYEGRAAMMINYAYHIPTIRAKSAHLKFGLAPVPQIKEAEFEANYASYWINTVSKYSKNQGLAWDFINFAIQKENAKNYLKATGRPPARRDLIQDFQNDELLAPFANQILTAKSWYQGDDILVEHYLSEMIETVVSGKETIPTALEKVNAQIWALVK